MASCGDTFRSNCPPRHIWVIISDPDDNEGKFVFVNLTTFTETCVDDGCILEPKDYPPYLTHETTVAYSRYHIGNETAIMTLLATGKFVEMPAIPPATLEKIIEGARSSPHLPPVAVKMLPK